MNELEQKIWELCGSPREASPVCITHAPYKCVCDLHKPIDIGLAHVMQLLEPKILKINIIGNFLELRCSNFAAKPQINIFLKLLNENNGAALLRDQSEETQLAILEVVK